MNIQNAIDGIRVARQTLEALRLVMVDHDKRLIDEEARALQQELTNLLELMKQTKEESHEQTDSNH